MTHDIEITDGYSMELEPVASAPVTLFRSDDPNEIVARATETANALSAVVKAKKLTVRIGPSDHVRVEGWTLLGTMLGVFPVCVWTHKLEDGWEARVEARTLAGLVVGAAEAQCTRSEQTWSRRDDYALRSMAQTRATSKALRQPLGFVMTLAGFNPTPAEEMPPVTQHTSGGTAKVITKKQLDRLHAIAGEAKCSEDEQKRIVAEIAGVKSRTLIPVDKYEAVVAAIEAHGTPF